ncbi:replicative DNA helicase [Luteibacter sp. Sphag1AF]|uniref:replicative DNA helicase n=1 Tax=Luteibacter sp. Sphag1AF TaxID=2587031 RepID=UPI001620AF76|nr:DnaB-like helicase C-terminal domain-containing protein [Luteibacter sp. Sphag1AF]MBB3227024.1 replicative DNA helicase [Luteibacter sp. Sphag1AF]
MSASEQAVVGAILLDANAYWQVSDIIGAEDFGDQRNARLFAKLKESCEAGSPVDFFVVAESFGDRNMSAYTMDVANNATSAANARAYADVVRQDSERRKVVAAGRRMALEAPTFNEAQAILAQVAPRNAKSSKSAPEVLVEVMDGMQSRLEMDGSITGLSTGIGNFDRRTSGLHSQTLTIIAGRPSMGKTALAMQIAVNVALTGKRVYIATMEMSARALMERAIAYVARVDYGLIRRPKLLREEDWMKVVSATEILNKSGLIIDETPAQTKESLTARVQQHHMSSPLSLIVVDHLGLFKLPGKGRPDLETGSITKDIRNTAKKLDIPAIVLVQLNRSLESRQDRRPILADLRESGGIEEDADVVAMVYRDEYYHSESPQKGFAELIFRKNREDETGTEPLRAHLSQMHFADCEDLPYESEPERKPSGSHGRFGRISGFQARGRED